MAGPDLAAEGKMRRRILWMSALGPVIGWASVRGVEPKAAKGVLAGLKVGQPVVLKGPGTVAFRPSGVAVTYCHQSLCGSRGLFVVLRPSRTVS